MIQKKWKHFRHFWSFPFDIFYLIYLNIMGINQDIQFDTILIKERHISVDYVHEFDGGSFQIYIPKSETIYLYIRIFHPWNHIFECHFLLYIYMFQWLRHITVCHSVPSIKSLICTFLIWCAFVCTNFPSIYP